MDGYIFFFQLCIGRDSPDQAVFQPCKAVDDTGFSLRKGIWSHVGHDPSSLWDHVCTPWHPPSFWGLKPWSAEKGTEEEIKEIKVFRNDSVGTAVFSESSTCDKSDFHWNQNINLLIFFHRPYSPRDKASCHLWPKLEKMRSLLLLSVSVAHSKCNSLCTDPLCK